MFTLATRKKPRVLRRWAFGSLAASLICLLFSAVYEAFSHGVYSNYMLYAFAIPLVGGTFAAFLLEFFSKKTMPGRNALALYNAGLSTLTTGSVMKGVLDLYGTTNRLVILYLPVGLVLVLSGVAAYYIGVAYIRRSFE